MKDGFNLKALFPRSDGKQTLWYSDLGDEIILFVVIFFFCIVGLVGNGTIIWLLGFRIKRKPFAVYLLNLAVADSGFLVLLLPLMIYIYRISNYNSDISPIAFCVLVSIFISMHSSRHLLLTALSIDRWVSVLFPNWYQCHQSVVLSTTVCALIWALFLVLGGVPLIQEFTLLLPGSSVITIAGEYVVSTLICLLTVSISGLTLLVKACLKSQPCRHRSLLRVILLILLSFLLFIIMTIVCFFVTSIPLAYYGLWTSLKSSMNPVIYFLAGRQNCGKSQERMKVILQRVFKEERETRLELQPCAQAMPSGEHLA